MQTVWKLVEIIALIVITGTLVWVASELVHELRKFGRTAEDVSHFLKVAEDEITNTTKEARTAISDIDKLVGNVNIAVETIEKAAEDVHRILDLTMITATTLSAVKSSTAGFASVYEGIKQGIKALYGPERSQKGGTKNEQ